MSTGRVNKPVQSNNGRVTRPLRRTNSQIADNPRVVDARLRIIQKNRQRMTDARDKLSELAKQTDARNKIKGRNPKLRVQLAATNRMDWPARRCHTTAAAARHGWRIVADKPLRCHN
ncbi:hypothetical protein J6590_090554 [Homalodisca vitripennis]|nr:hypothetical protein J6590_090554 [Homalodisca vitripennis]